MVTTRRDVGGVLRKDAAELVRKMKRKKGQGIRVADIG